MFIERDDHRWWRFALSGGFFIALMLLIMFNSSVLTMIDAVLQSLFTSQRLEGIGWFHALMSLLSFLAKPVLDLVWVFIIAGVLWLKGYRIPALWSLGTILVEMCLGQSLNTSLSGSVLHNTWQQMMAIVSLVVTL